MVVFPHTNGFEADEDTFLAMWRALIAEFCEGKTENPNVAIPRLNKAVNLHQLLQGEVQFSVEMICRAIVPVSYRNTMHATKIFLQRNNSIMEPCRALNHSTKRMVNAVRLSRYGQDRAAAICPSKIAKAAEDMHSLVDSCLDTEQAAAPKLDITRPMRQIVTQGQRTSELDLAALVELLVDQIEEEPFWATYRKKRLSVTSVQGWAGRLEAYFWPTPKTGYLKTIEQIKPLIDDATNIAARCTEGWDEKTMDTAVSVAHRIFEWGSVPQSNVTAEKVQSVLQSAVAQRDLGAPMNSGWTKLAALGTSHLEELDGAHVIWDSRVANSLVTRFDRILENRGENSIPAFLRGIGEVPGRGGSRTNRVRSLKWPSAYQKWNSQFAASRLVRLIRDRLNDCGIARPRIAKSANWTVREVEMVLFMDGY